MQTLYIDTHHSKSFRLGYQTNSVFKIIQGNDSAVEMINAIEKLTQNNIQQIIINKGPGSLTGLRIGASFAQGICLAKNIPLKALSIWDLVLTEYPTIEIFFYTGTKKWIKKTYTTEEVFTELPTVSSLWTSNNPAFFKTLDMKNYIEFPNIIQLMHKYAEQASTDAGILYPINFF